MPSAGKMETISKEIRSSIKRRIKGYVKNNITANKTTKQKRQRLPTKAASTASTQKQNTNYFKINLLTRYKQQ